MLAANPTLQSRRWRLSGLTRRASDNGSPLDLLDTNVAELIEQAPVSRTPLEAMDRVMLLIADRTPSLSGWVPVRFRYDAPLIFVRDAEELRHVVDLLERRGLLERDTT
jgi:hypothetical protein